MARSRSRTLAATIALVIPTLLALSGAGSSEANDGFRETWDDGLGDWDVTGPGATMDCSTAVDGCALRVAPECCSNRVFVARNGSWALDGPTVLSYWFRASATSGNTDFEVLTLFEGGDEVIIGFTGGSGSSNNNMQVVSKTDGVWERGGGFYQWRADTWYEVLVAFFPADGVGAVTIRDVAGQDLSTSPTFPAPSGAAVLERVTVKGVMWQQDVNVLHMDDVRFGPGPVLVPRNLETAAGPGPDAVTLAWEAPARSDVAFTLYRSMHPDGPFDAVGTVTGRTTWRDEGVSGEGPWYYHVTASTGGEEGPASATVCGTTIAASWLACPDAADGRARTVVAAAFAPGEAGADAPTEDPGLVRVTGAPSERFPGSYHVRVEAADAPPQDVHAFTGGLVQESFEVSAAAALEAYADARDAVVIVRLTQFAEPAFGVCAVAAGDACSVYLPVNPLYPYGLVWGGDATGFRASVRVMDASTGATLAHEDVFVPYAGQAGLLVPAA